MQSYLASPLTQASGTTLGHTDNPADVHGSTYPQQSPRCWGETISVSLLHSQLTDPGFKTSNDSLYDAAALTGDEDWYVMGAALEAGCMTINPRIAYSYCQTPTQSVTLHITPISGVSGASYGLSLI